MMTQFSSRPNFVALDVFQIHEALRDLRPRVLAPEPLLVRPDIRDAEIQRLRDFSSIYFSSVCRDYTKLY